MSELLCGIDEAGRGCLAGSLFIAGVILPPMLLENGFFEGLTDSKQITPNRREEWFIKIIQNSHFCIIEKSPSAIDNLGLSHCLQDGLKNIQKALPCPRYIFDGNTNFGVLNIDTLIKGDCKIKAISAASILAKVCKDTQMKVLAKEFPLFSFENNKGYGTKQHIQAIVRFGISPIHRKSFCNNLSKNFLF